MEAADATVPPEGPATVPARHDEGMAVRRAVLGEEHVAAAQAATSDLDAPFQTFITEGAWGSVWARPGLDLRTRSLLTIALLAAKGHWEEVAMHLRASRNTGASPSDIAEALLHVAVYAGVPAANRAFGLLKAEFGADAGPRGPDDRGGP
ncbi:MAG: 4-carboxymuconolactone decarboxylase [Egibacteraceae bacterium]